MELKWLISNAILLPTSPKHHKMLSKSGMFVLYLLNSMKIVQSSEMYHI